MQIETPYRSNAASPLEMKVIELGGMLNNLIYGDPQIEKFYHETSDALKRFGYKKSYHRDFVMEPDLIMCVNYYTLARRIVVLSVDKGKQSCGLIEFGHDDYYTVQLEIH